MIHDLRQTVLKSEHDQFVYPAYGGYAFSDISNTILALFGVDPGRATLHPDIFNALKAQQFKHILFVLIDGLGFDNWVDRAIKLPFFRKVSERGDVTSLTAVFPSTTSASLPAFSTGLTPQEHGLPEWTIYLKDINDYILTLPFRRWNANKRDELTDLGLDGSILFQGRTIHEKLAEAGIPSMCVSGGSYAFSVFSNASNRGATRSGFFNGSDLVLQLSDQLNAAQTPSFFYLYWDEFDNLEHRYGPYSREVGFELEHLDWMLGEQLLRHIDPAVAKDTLLLISADHGQNVVSDERITYLTDFPELKAMFEPRGKRQWILPTGGSRDTFLHIREDKLDEAKAFLDEQLAGKAEVWKTQEVFDRGLFGIGDPLPMFRERVGNLLVLPHPGEMTWGEFYSGNKKFPSHFRGHHGGLTPNEMFIPFAAIKLDALGK